MRSRGGAAHPRRGIPPPCLRPRVQRAPCRARASRVPPPLAAVRAPRVDAGNPRPVQAPRPGRRSGRCIPRSGRDQWGAGLPPRQCAGDCPRSRPWQTLRQAGWRRVVPACPKKCPCRMGAQPVHEKSRPKQKWCRCTLSRPKADATNSRRTCRKRKGLAPFCASMPISPPASSSPNAVAPIWEREPGRRGIPPRTKKPSRTSRWSSRFKARPRRRSTVLRRE